MLYAMSVRRSRYAAVDLKLLTFVEVKLLTFPRRAAPVWERSFLDVPRRAANVQPGDLAPPDSLLIPGRGSALLLSEPRRLSSRRKKCPHDHAAAGSLSFSPAVTISCISPRRCDWKPCSVAHPATPAFDIRCVESGESCSPKHRRFGPRLRCREMIDPGPAPTRSLAASEPAATRAASSRSADLGPRSPAPGQDCAGLRSVQFNERSDGCNSPIWRGLGSGWVS